jgi:hypothetical protein
MLNGIAPAGRQVRQGARGGGDRRASARSVDTVDSRGARKAARLRHRLPRESYFLAITSPRPGSSSSQWKCENPATRNNASNSSSV